MRRLLLLMLTIGIFAVDGSAIKITPDEATQLAKDFVNFVEGGSGPFQPTVTVVKTVYSADDPSQPVYYICNARYGLFKKRFVIVAGETSVVDILAYGDGFLDVDNIPEAMSALLDYYSEEIGQLLQPSNPGNGDIPRSRLDSGDLVNTTGFQLLTTKWGQYYPYNVNCPTTAEGAYCLTGCAATAMAQVLNYWEYPYQLPAVDGYQQTSPDIFVDPLFDYYVDWSLMKDCYDKTNVDVYADSVQAVASLMRHVGQALHMNYSPRASSTDVLGFVDLLNSYGYNAYRLRKDQVVSDSLWRNMMIAELDAGRPIIYSATKDGGGGHVFDVDGYMLENGIPKFHINWGWEGKDNNSDTTSNGYFYLNEFTGSNTVWSNGQGMVLGIDNIPALTVDQDTLSFTGYVGSASTSQTFTLTGNVAYSCLNEPVYLTIEGDSAFSLQPDVIDAQQVAEGAQVEVTYGPQMEGDHQATLIITSPVVEQPIRVRLRGHATAPTPTLQVSTMSMSFEEVSGYTQTQTFKVTGKELTGDVTLTLTGNSSGAITVSPTVIPRDSALNGATVTVSYSPQGFDNTRNTRIHVSSPGCTSRSVRLMGQGYLSETWVDVSDPEIIFDDGHTDYVQTKTFDVMARIYYQKSADDDTYYDMPIRDSLMVFFEDDEQGQVFSVSPEKISPEDAYRGTTVTVTYAPEVVGESAAYIDLWCRNTDAGNYVCVYGQASSESCLRTSCNRVNFDHAHTGYDQKLIVELSAYHVTGDIHVDLIGGDGVFSVSPSVIPAEGALDVPVYVTHAPDQAGTQSATLAFSALGVDTVFLPLEGHATADPCIDVDSLVLLFNEYTGYSQTKSLHVKTFNMSEDVTVRAIGSDTFTFTPETISGAEAAQGATIQVTYSPVGKNIVGHEGQLILEGSGAQPDTVDLIGQCTESMYYIDSDVDTCLLTAYDAVPDTATVIVNCSVFKIPFNPGDDPVYSSAASPGGDEETQNLASPGMSRYIGAVGQWQNIFYQQLGLCFAMEIDGEDADDFQLLDTLAYAGYPLSRFYVSLLPYIVQTKLPIGTDSQSQTEVSVRLKPRTNVPGQRHATLHISPVGFVARPITVELIGDVGIGAIPVARGDVDGNEIVDINDVTMLIQCVLSGETEGVNIAGADVNYDGEVDINDVTVLIQYVLTGSWPEP